MMSCPGSRRRHNTDERNIKKEERYKKFTGNGDTRRSWRKAIDYLRAPKLPDLHRVAYIFMCRLEEGLGLLYREKSR